MRLTNLLVLNAVVALAFGIAFLLLPGTVITLYGATPGPEINLVGQLFGVELVSVGLLCWFARNVADGLAQRAIVLAHLVADAIGLLISLIGTLSAVLNAVGWSAVVIYLVLTLGYAYFRFIKPPPA